MPQKLSFIERKIKRIAFEKLKVEWFNLRSTMKSTPLIQKFQLEELNGHSFPDCFPLNEENLKFYSSYVGMFKPVLLEKLVERLAEIENEETNNLLQKINNLEYLFRE